MAGRGRSGAVRRLSVIAMAVLALILAACTSSQSVPPTTQVGIPPVTRPAPAVDLSATPARWVPVANGDAQVSVPANWFVLHGSPPCPTGSAQGEVFVNPPAGVFHCPAETAPGPSTTVSFGAIPTYDESQTPTAHGHREIINGIFVYPLAFGPRGSYLVPQLGVEVTVDGLLAQRVLHTLTRSPRAVALAHGPAPSVPPSWRWVTFAGLRLSVPANWPISRTSETPGLGAVCRTPGVAFSSTMVTLSTDERPPPIFYCPFIPPAPQRPNNAVQVDSGLRTEPLGTLSFSTHCLVRNGLSACPATSPAYSISVLRVRVGGRAKPVFVSIGLAGNGMVARTVLYSLRASSAGTRAVKTGTTVSEQQALREAGWTRQAVAIAGALLMTYSEVHANDPALAAGDIIDPSTQVWVVTVHLAHPRTVPADDGYGPPSGPQGTEKLSVRSVVINTANWRGDRLVLWLHRGSAHIGGRYATSNPGVRKLRTGCTETSEYSVG